MRTEAVRFGVKGGCMRETSARLLRLLALLQRQREWNASELGEEMSVTTRTVRRDIARLRELGYPVASTPGAGGGYQLEAGASLPPLMLDADEAVSVFLALRSQLCNSADSSLNGTLSAVDKLTRVMPSRLQETISALSDHTSELHLGLLIGSQIPATDLRSLVALSRACREERQIQCTFTRDGIGVPRMVEPLHLVKALGHWYLVAYCLKRHDWRTFRVDRLSGIEITHHPTTRRTPPSARIDDYVQASIHRGIRRVRATVRIHAAKEDIGHWILPAWGTVDRETATTSIAEVGAETFDAIARWLLLLDARISVVQPPDLLQAFARLEKRCTQLATDVTAQDHRS